MIEVVSFPTAVAYVCWLIACIVVTAAGDAAADVHCGWCDDASMSNAVTVLPLLLLLLCYCHYQQRAWRCCDQWTCRTLNASSKRRRSRAMMRTGETTSICLLCIWQCTANVLCGVTINASRQQHRRWSCRQRVRVERASANRSHANHTTQPTRRTPSAMRAPSTHSGVERQYTINARKRSFCRADERTIVRVRSHRTADGAHMHSKPDEVRRRAPSTHSQ